MDKNRTILWGAPHSLRYTVLGCLLLVTGSTISAENEFVRVDDGYYRLLMHGSEIKLLVPDRELQRDIELILAWVDRSVRTVTRFYNRFPVDKLRIRLRATNGDKVKFGQAFGGQAPLIRIDIGENFDSQALQKDWIMVHEMVHLAMADVPRQHRWWLEGLATYVESVARVEAGEQSAEFVWRNFIERMPQGLAKTGDRGLDRTPTWGRTYWGGALFCLLADIEIRQLSDNRLSLKHALRGILDAGYSMKASATLERILEAGDEALGFPVLQSQYARFRHAPEPREIDSVWRKLGISLEDGRIVYNDFAAQAEIRRQFFSL